MDEIIENEIRERVCEENFRRMRTVKNNFTVARVYNIYLSAALTLISWILVVNLSSILTVEQMVTSKGLDRADFPIYFPWYGATAFLTPLILVCSIIADLGHKRIFSALAFSVHLLIVLFAAANFLFHFEPMKISHMVFLIIYGALGMWSEDFALRSYKELDYLVTQEGYPDFNFNLEEGRYSRYVKYRNTWLKKKKKLDYFAPSEKPAQIPVSEKSEKESQMEEITLSDKDKSEWFAQAENIANEPPPAPPAPPESIDGKPLGEMTELQSEGFDSILGEEYDDPRRKPL